MNKIYQLDIRGYYRDEVRNKFPASQGIYFVYRGIINNVTRTCTLKALLYIGETDNLHSCFNEHINRPEFRNQLKDGEMLFYTYAQTNVSEDERKGIEEILIYELSPLLNNQKPNNNIPSQTVINIIGDRHAFIPSEIIAPSY